MGLPPVNSIPIHTRHSPDAAIRLKFSRSPLEKYINTFSDREDVAEEKKGLTAQELAVMKQLEHWKGYELNEAGHATLYIQFKGVWDMEGLLGAITEFYTREKFKYFEKVQRHRHPGPFGVERLYSIDAHRNLDEYCRWNSSVLLETFDEQDVEVMGKDGRKRKMAKGRLWIQLKGSINVDYERRWEGSWWTINLRMFLNRYIIRKRIELPYWDTFQYTIHMKLHRTIVNFLKMESKGPEPTFMGGVH